MTFLGMFAVAVFLSSVHEKLRREMVAARLNHGRVEALYGLARGWPIAGPMKNLLPGGRSSSRR